MGKSPEGEHDPNEKECDPTENPSTCPQNQHCRDDNADGHWSCNCKEGHYFDENRHCLLGKPKQIWGSSSEYFLSSLLFFNLDSKFVLSAIKWVGNIPYMLIFGTKVLEIRWVCAK